jgi:Tol biopolymer transport system component
LRAAALAGLAAAAPPAQAAERASLGPAGEQLDDTSLQPSLSTNGRYLAFESDSEEVVPEDANGFRDVFVRDRKTGENQRVSVATGGAEADQSSTNASLSGNGRYVAFSSSATNLVAEDDELFPDIFFHDRKQGTTTRVSRPLPGPEEVDGQSIGAFVSRNGRFVAFSSFASNLVEGDGNGVADAFVWERKTGLVTRVSVSSAGVESAMGGRVEGISASGRYVSFVSSTPDLVADDENGEVDIFVYDRRRGATRRASLASDGSEAEGQSYGGALSASGRYVAFNSYATNLAPGDFAKAYVKDLKTGELELVSVTSAGEPADEESEGVVISSSGRFVAFQSDATNLDPVVNDENDEDVFFRDRKRGTTVRLSVDPAGEGIDGNCARLAISGKGRVVAFDSPATDLVAGDGNAATDVFVSEPE